MKVAIIGSRRFSQFTLEELMEQIPAGATEIVSGGASGVDRMAEQAARLLGLPCKIFYPNYPVFGRQAPLSRNRQIADYADLVLAFWDNHSRGTAHTINYCIQTHKPFQIFNIK